MTHHISTCPACGGPIFGSLLNSSHQCRPTPFTVVYQAPRTIPAMSFTIESPPKPVEPSSLADAITPGEATRLCHLIGAEICNHRVSCEYCKLANKLQLPIQPCKDGIALQEAFKKWEQYTLIEVDRT
jgi:hypothetical protein